MHKVASPLFSLEGRSAIVTGSSRGIGRAIAWRMAEAGANVVITSRRQEKGIAVAEEINRSFGEGRAIALAAEIGDKSSLEAMVAAAKSQFGRIGILVCNAASNPYYGPMSGMDDSVFETILRNNIMSAHWLVTLLRDDLAADGRGSIIFVSSIGGLIGSSAIGAYNISKAADMQLARNLSVELGAQNVRVNTLAPGLIRTDFSRALWEDAGARATFESQTSLGRIGRADEIAGAAVFLASDAASYITGQTLIIDGGKLAGGG